MGTREAFMKNGKMFMLALDHRGSLERMLPASFSFDTRTQTIIDIKTALISSLAPYATGVLLDFQYGLPAYGAYQSQPQSVSLSYLLCIEKTGYTDTHNERITELEYTVSELKAKGAAGVKLLLFFHPDAETAEQQVALTKKVSEDCKTHNLPFFLEILNYSFGGKPYDAHVLVPRSVRMFLEYGVRADVFKLEFPETAASCAEITRLLGETPWILLTKGAPYQTFVAGLTVAMAHGCRGFLAGRSLWQDFSELPREEWKNFFETTVRERFQEITQATSGQLCA